MPTLPSSLAFGNNHRRSRKRSFCLPVLLSFYCEAVSKTKDVKHIYISGSFFRHEEEVRSVTKERNKHGTRYGASRGASYGTRPACLLLYPTKQTGNAGVLPAMSEKYRQKATALIKNHKLEKLQARVASLEDDNTL